MMESVGMSGGRGGEGLFIRLKSGDSATGVFLGEPESRAIVWDDAVGHSVRFQKEIHAKNEMRMKHAWNFYDVDAKEIRILEINHSTRISLDEMAGKIEAGGSELDRWVCKISRRGSGKETQYWIENVRELEPSARERLGSIYMNDAHDLADIMGSGEAATTAKTAFETGRQPAPVAVAPVAVAPQPPPAAVGPAPDSGSGPDFDLF